MEYRPRIEYSAGDRLGDFGIIYLEESDPIVSLYGGKKSKSRCAKFRCAACQNEFTTRIVSVKSNGTKSCGCLLKAVATQNGYDSAQGHRNIANVRGRYTVSVTTNGKSKHVGCFDRIEDAIEARDNYKRSLNPKIIDRDS